MYVLCIVKKGNTIEVCDFTENTPGGLHAEERFCQNPPPAEQLTADRAVTLYITLSPCSKEEHGCAQKLDKLLGGWKAAVSIKFVDQY